MGIRKSPSSRWLAESSTRCRRYWTGFGRGRLWHYSPPRLPMHASQNREIRGNLRVSTVTVRKTLRAAGIERLKPLRRAGERAPVQGTAPVAACVPGRSSRPTASAWRWYGTRATAAPERGKTPGNPCGPRSCTRAWSSRPRDGWSNALMPGTSAHVVPWSTTTDRTGHCSLGFAWPKRVSSRIRAGRWQLDWFTASGQRVHRTGAAQLGRPRAIR